MIISENYFGSSITENFETAVKKPFNGHRIQRPPKNKINLPG